MKSIAELTAILEEQNPDIKHCVVCGMPYIPYHSRQKTCGDPECVKINHRAYTKEYVKNMGEEQKIKHRASNLAYMRKKRARKAAEKNMDALGEYWQGRKEKEDNVTERDGISYGERQRQKILQQVTKIRTEL